MHVHLDPVGGMAGDMFVAALLDAVPGAVRDVERALGVIDLPDEVRWRLVAHDDGTFAGRRFVVTDPPGGAHGSGSDHHAVGDAGPGADHGHRAHREVVDLLEGAALDDAVRARALDVFERLAVAEGTVHGIDPADVTFHEVGAWDSIVDIVAAAAAIEALGPTTWSIAALPLGSGRVHTAHGVMPVPAPATAVLLEGRMVIDDGVPGERVTPTGAAIVAHLDPAPRPPAGPLRLCCSGHGFGTKTFPGLPNMVRALCSQPVEDRA